MASQLLRQQAFGSSNFLIKRLLGCRLQRSFALYQCSKATSRLPDSILKFATRSAHTSSAEISSASPTTKDDYRGPLAPTFRRLKIFSLSSLGLSIVFTPFIFIIESSIPLAARFALAAMALGTSSTSTALISWCGEPYVATLRRLDEGGLEMTTLTLGLRERITRVYDRKFLVETKRPFAKWELAEAVALPKHQAFQTTSGDEETVAETLDIEGNILGRWVVKWGENGKGKCHERGKVARYFNVHEELL